MAARSFRPMTCPIAQTEGTGIRLLDPRSVVLSKRKSFSIRAFGGYFNALFLLGPIRYRSATRLFRLAADLLGARSMLSRACVPVNPSSLVAFRVFYGLLGAVGAIRFLVNGWVERFFVEPSFHFHYYGFEWIEPLAPSGMTAVFLALATLGVFIAAGFLTRVSLALFFGLFTYVELIDVTNYLNHYYLFSLLALWLLVLPVGDHGSVDAIVRRRRDPEWSARPMPAWAAWVLRAQVGAVYMFAAVAKATPDWLMHGQPLGIWLGARAEVPIIGPLLALPGTAIVASWAGFLHDLLVVPALLWKPSRPFAYAGLVCFHVATSALFPIGMFPLIMIASATVFFEPDWAARFLPRTESAAPLPRVAPPWRRVGASLVVAFALFQFIWPLRAFAYGGDVLWHEQGMRFSWRVMCREKNGSVSYRLTTRERTRVVPASRYLSSSQEREMSSQPDLIAQLARHIAAEEVARGGEDVRVYVDALVSLNGRPMARLIDPDVDLGREPDGLAPADWILPAPTTEPLVVTR